MGENMEGVNHALDYTKDYGIDAERLERASLIGDSLAALEVLYPSDEISELTKDLIGESGFLEQANGREWAVFVLDGKSKFADIAKRVEVERFSEFFGTHPLEHIGDYCEYDESSIFVLVVDCKDRSSPKPAAELRAVKNGPRGIKTVNTLVSGEPEANPWSVELGSQLGSNDPDSFYERIKIHPDKTWGIETMAALKGYAGNSGEFGAATFPLYAVCLQLSDRAGVNSWVSIQDVRPLKQMQDLFDKPWETLEVEAKSFEGPYPTIPAYIPSLDAAEQKLRGANPEMAELMIDGIGLKDQYALPDELQSAEYIEAVIN